MSDSETFLSRWLRLKRESEAALPPADPPSPAAFDATRLPPVESIIADSDIQQFLHGAVPEELTRAALRRAWSADPAVRDFIGIAENQWNFNDHACIPGFGPLEAADQLAARAFGSLTNVASEAHQGAEVGKIAEVGKGGKGAEVAEQPALPGSEPLEAARPAAGPPIIGTTTPVVATAGVPGSADEGESGGKTLPGAAAPRTHGGALPQ